MAEIGIVGNFVEVWLARQGHANPVGINYLEKIQTPHLVAIYGAMLAGVGFVLMGAGIPLKIPAVLDAYVHHQPASYPLYVVGAQDGDDVAMHFTPRELIEGRSGDDAELPFARHRLRQPPVRHRHTHAALDDLGKV